jgi:ubiquinone/menaquinone biosynthesis C-methylase UbiE
MARHARAHGVKPRITAVDFNPATIELAKRRCADYPEIEFVAGDALQIAREQGDPEGREGELPYDLVHCSLALHHFSEQDAMELLKNCGMLGKRVLIADLERAWFTTLGVWLLTALFYREPMTKHDGRVSARRAFSHREFRQLAKEAGWMSFSHERFAFCRQAVWLE